MQPNKARVIEPIKAIVVSILNKSAFTYYAMKYHPSDYNDFFA